MLALYAIKWDFDKTEINLKEYERIEDGGVEEYHEDNVNDIGDSTKTACCNIF